MVNKNKRIIKCLWVVSLIIVNSQHGSHFLLYNLCYSKANFAVFNGKILMKQINTLRHKIIQLLQRLEFFKDFNNTDVTLLVEGKGMIVLAEVGEYIIKEGTVDPTLYIPLSGELEVRVTNEAGNEIAIAKVPPGETIGEAAFITDSPRTANVVALKQTLLFRCSRSALKTLAPSAREKIKDQIILKLIERLHQKNIELSNRS